MMTVRRRLLLTLLPALALLMLAGGAADYWIAGASTRDAYDHALASTAMAVAHSIVVVDGHARFVPVAQDTARIPLGTNNPFDSGLFRITGPAGEFLAGNQDLPDPAIAGRLAKVQFSDLIFQDQPLRIASMRIPTSAGTVSVVVAEARAMRARTQQVMLFGKLLVDFAELDITLLLVWIAVYYGLRPLDALRNQVESSQSLRALRRLDESQVPGELRAVVMAFNQVLELLQDAALAQQRFVADAAHQMRTPVAGLLAQLELLIADPQASALSAQLASVQSGIARLAHSANQLLALARADPALALYENFAPVALEPLVSELVVRHLNLADQAGIDLGADAAPASVLGEAWLLEDLLNNLIDNAIKYTPPGGHVTVRCGQDGKHAFLEVEDDGSGIPVADRQRVKERFFRQPGSPGTGCGLGLAIVEEIARTHRAQFTIGSGTLERGSVMRVRFPAAA